MPRAAGLLRVAFLCLAIAACRGGGDERAAWATAQAWLPAIDEGDYAQGWTAGAPYLQRAITQEQWVASMHRMRQPLGKVLSRTLTSSQATTCALTNACVVIQTAAAFEHKPAATETITVMPADGGRWQVAGYYIQ